MNIGRMTKKITIRSSTRANNSYGEPVETWADFATKWAEVNTKTLAEDFIADKKRTREPIEFRIRYTSGVTNQMKVVYGGNDYDILSVVNTDLKNKEMILTCIRIS